MIKIIECRECKAHSFQDSRYGNKKRVCNLLGVNPEKSEYRCTVCLVVHKVNE